LGTCHIDSATKGYQPHTHPLKKPSCASLINIIIIIIIIIIMITLLMCQRNVAKGTEKSPLLMVDT